MTEAQKKWMADNPKFSPVGPPRNVTFSEWGSLYPDGTYEQLDNQPLKPIRVGGSIGVAVLAHS